ncbi:glyoxalase [Streptomyces beijiangensis]|uniref:Glyoxalase n=1 Tax=Streptomyces beijiangensis TaxID=163361 RepID=A0A939JMR2_9ACTN|nr:glyoxalase [Streptomyces beijiangensis]MBO0517054.1 glyoxalase [Streptomyces beijiangensis]
MVMATTASTAANTSLSSVTLEVADLESARRFYSAFGVDTYISLRASEAPSTGFRGFTLALTVAGPATVDSFVGAAVDAGATVLKPAAKSLWGYSGVVQAPDGTIWKIATSEKKDTGPATREIDEVVLLIGVEDVKATKQLYVGRGLTVAKSFGGKYAEFAPGRSSSIKLALYKRRALAKEVGVPEDGTGSHRIVLGSTADALTDPDGFSWETAASVAPTLS